MKNILAALIGVTVVVGLASCATTKDWAATGGSRSDGTVKLSYQYGMFESPKVSEQQAVELATSKCAAWGYSGAQAFGGEFKTCNAYNGYGSCVSWLVTAEYQCLGGPGK
jgi:hypothetical protein